MLGKNKRSATDRPSHRGVDVAGELMRMDQIDAGAANVCSDPPRQQHILPGPAMIADDRKALLQELLSQGSNDIETPNLHRDAATAEETRKLTDNNFSPTPR